MTSAISAAGEDFKVKRMTAIPSQPEFVPREILVKFKPAVPDEAINRMNRAHGTSVIYTSRFAGFKSLRIPPAKTIEEMVEIYSKNPNVEYAEPNAICYAFMVPMRITEDTYWPPIWPVLRSSPGTIL
jgi:serine protease